MTLDRPAGWRRPLVKGLGRAVEPPPPSGPNALNVALYEWVPRPGRFKDAITAAWYAQHPDITLNWCDYDCYDDDPPATLDVFAFDTIYAAYFIEQHYLKALPILDLDDYFAWSLSGLAVNSEWLWAVPYLGCMNVLYYRDSDPDIGPGLTNDQLFTILGASPDISPKPPPGQGLLIDYHGTITDACMYLQTVMLNANAFPIAPVLPPWNDLNPEALRDLRQLVTMAGEKQAAYKDPAADRMDWFLGGLGRAFVGLTETMGFMTAQQIDSLQFVPLPLADNPVDTIPLFADAWGINSAIDEGKSGLADDFVTIATNRQTSLAALLPRSSDQVPQYLTPVRESVAAKLASAFAPYKFIQSLITGSTAAFRIGVDSREWLTANAQGIANEILQTEMAIATVGAPAASRSSPAGIWRRAPREAANI